MFRTAVSSGGIWGVAIATSTMARTNKHFMGASGHCERGDYSKNIQWRRMPGQLGSTQSDGGWASVEGHGVGLRPEVGKPEMSSDFSACGLCLDHGQAGSYPAFALKTRIN